ncbi:MAG: hypothetical protein OXU50_08480 [Gammaproteobacteria bacterium]|nr:hypothetical protein [Gammaproteobacteria bacterium]
MIILAATLVALLVGTAYYAGTGFWKKPRLAIVTFVSLFVPAVVLLPLSGWKPPLLGWSSGWTYLALVYLAVHLAGLVAWFWALVAERAVRLFHKVKNGLAIFLGLAAAWYILAPYIVMADEEILWTIAGLILIAIVVAGGLRLFRILRGKLAGWKEKRKAAKDRAQASQQAQETRPPQDQPAKGWPPKDQSPQDRATETRSPADQPQSEPSESHPEDGKTVSARLKNLMKNVRGRVHMKVRTKNGRPRFSLSVIIENLRSCIPWRISIGNIIPLLRRLFSIKKWFARLCRTIRARFSRSDKAKTPPS